jgi:hypothetical protein
MPARRSRPFRGAPTSMGAQLGEHRHGPVVVPRVVAFGLRRVVLVIPEVVAQLVRLQAVLVNPSQQTTRPRSAPHLGSDPLDALSGQLLIPTILPRALGMGMIRPSQARTFGM